MAQHMRAGLCACMLLATALCEEQLPSRGDGTCEHGCSATPGVSLVRRIAETSKVRVSNVESAEVQESSNEVLEVQASSNQTFDPILMEFLALAFEQLYNAWELATGDDDYILINAEPDQWASRNSTDSGWYFQATFGTHFGFRDGGEIHGPMPFGAGMLVRGDEVNYMKVGGGIGHTKVPEYFDPELPPVYTDYWWVVNETCDSHPSQPLGKKSIQVYVGNCEFKKVERPVTADKLAYEVCAGVAEPDKNECAQRILCALDGLAWPEREPPRAAGSASLVPSTTHCPLATTNGTRPGAYRLGSDCRRHAGCNTGPCDDYCGGDGLCCREPGPLDYWEHYSWYGCGNKGCPGYHCCVRND